MKAGALLKQCWQCKHCHHRPTINGLAPIRTFSLSVRTLADGQQQGPIKAAPPIDFNELDRSGYQDDRLKFARIVPASPSYFTGNPEFVDALLRLQSLERRYESLPTISPSAAPRVSWKKLSEFRNDVGEPVKAAKYKQIVNILRRLNRIHPDLVPEEVTTILDRHKRDINPHTGRETRRVVDELGRAKGIGRRKASSAKVFLVEGNGECQINGKNINTVFGRIHDRESALWALKVTDRLDKYNVWALVSGGGTTGQAEAITLGVAKALLVHEPALKPTLRRAGVITRDPRKVERKKPGRLKARKKPAWVKR